MFPGLCSLLFLWWIEIIFQVEKKEQYSLYVVNILNSDYGGTILSLRLWKALLILWILVNMMCPICYNIGQVY